MKQKGEISHSWSVKLDWDVNSPQPLLPRLDHYHPSISPRPPLRHSFPVLQQWGLVPISVNFAIDFHLVPFHVAVDSPPWLKAFRFVSFFLSFYLHSSLSSVSLFFVFLLFSSSSFFSYSFLFHFILLLFFCVCHRNFFCSVVNDIAGDRRSTAPTRTQAQAAR